MRSSKSMTGLLVGTITALSLTAGSAFANDNRTGQGATVPWFVEQPGNLEFSGSMIARPVQNDPARNNAARTMILENFIVRMYIDLNDEYVFQLPQGVGENQAAQALMATGLFEYIQPDWICYPQLVPNDPSRNTQWHHSRMENYAGWDVHVGDPGTPRGHLRYGSPHNP